MTFLKKNWLFTLFVIAVLGISGYFFYLSQKPLEVSEAPAPSVPKTIEPPAQPKPPVGDTSQGGHWHGDEWHAEPHDVSSSAQSEEPTSEPIVESSDTADAGKRKWITQAQIDETFRKFGKEEQAIRALAKTDPEEYRRAFKAFKKKVDAFLRKLRDETKAREVIRFEAFAKMDAAIAELKVTPSENQARIDELNAIIREQRKIAKEN